VTVTPDGGTYGVEVINDADEWVPGIGPRRVRALARPRAA